MDGYSRNPNMGYSSIRDAPGPFWSNFDQYTLTLWDLNESPEIQLNAYWIMKNKSESEKLICVDYNAIFRKRGPFSFLFFPQPSNPPTLQPSNPPALQPSFPPSLLPSFTHSLLPSFPPLLIPSFPTPMTVCNRL